MLERSRDRTIGSGLIEVIVSMALMGIVMVGVAGMFKYGSQQYRSFQSLIDLQREGLVAMERISQEMTDTNRSGLEFYTAPYGVVFTSKIGTDGSLAQDWTGRMLWRKFIGYYVTGERQLLRKEAGFSDMMQAPKPTNMGRSAAQMRDDVSLEPRLIAKGVTKLEGNIEVNTVRLSMTIRVDRDDSGTRFDENVITTSFRIDR